MTARNSYCNPGVLSFLSAALACFGLFPSTSLGGGLGKPDAAARTSVIESYGRLPLRFEANRGQADPRIKFLSRDSHSALYLTADEAVLWLSSPVSSEAAGKTDAPASTPAADTTHDFVGAAVRMKLVGANPDPQVIGVNELPGKTNYYLGSDPSRWTTHIPNYARVKYEAVYPGVDLIYYGHQRKLEYDFIVAPGVDPRIIAIAFTGINGLKIDAQGDLILHTAAGDLRHQKPAAYQEIDGVRKPIAGRYVLYSDRHVGFRLGIYDTRRPLVIDPKVSLVYSTFLGGGNADEGRAIAVDLKGHAYVAGYTIHASSNVFPMVNTCPANKKLTGKDIDVFVAKINPAGSALVWSTYFGGTSKDWAWGIALDDLGYAYVTGETISDDFPTTANMMPPYDETYGGGEGAIVRAGELFLSGDAFVAKLSYTSGCVLYSTYIGGSDGDCGYDIAVDSEYNAYVVGNTASADFPNVAGATVPKYDLKSKTDAFFVKLGGGGVNLIYSIRFGGAGAEGGYGIALDPAGNAYLAGTTDSHDFPTVNPIQATHGNSGGYYGLDAFIVQFDTAGSMVFSTFLGGSDHDRANDIAWVKGDIEVLWPDAVYVTGSTESTDFPRVEIGGGHTVHGGGADAFIAMVDVAQKKIRWSKYLGGSEHDGATGVATEWCGSAYVVGWTHSSDFPTTDDCVQATKGGGRDAFVTKFGPVVGFVMYSTYLGGSGNLPSYSGEDRGWGIAVDKSLDCYVTGDASSADFPVTASALDGTFANPADAFVTKMHEEVPTIKMLEEECGDCGAIGTITYGGALVGYLGLMFVRRRRQ